MGEKLRVLGESTGFGGSSVVEMKMSHSLVKSEVLEAIEIVRSSGIWR